MSVWARARHDTFRVVGERLRQSGARRAHAIRTAGGAIVVAAARRVQFRVLRRVAHRAKLALNAARKRLLGVPVVRARDAEAGITSVGTFAAARGVLSLRACLARRAHGIQARIASHLARRRGVFLVRNAHLARGARPRVRVCVESARGRGEGVGCALSARCAGESVALEVEFGARDACTGIGTTAADANMPGRASVAAAWGAHGVFRRRARGLCVVRCRAYAAWSARAVPRCAGDIFVHVCKARRAEGVAAQSLQTLGAREARLTLKTSVRLQDSAFTAWACRIAYPIDVSNSGTIRFTHATGALQRVYCPCIAVVRALHASGRRT